MSCGGVCGRGGVGDAGFEWRVGCYDVSPALVLHLCVLDKDADFGCCGVDGAKVECVEHQDAAIV